MLKKIISGCQTGADIAAIDAAIDNGFPYGGWVPKGRLNEASSLPVTARFRDCRIEEYQEIQSCVS